MTRGSPLVECIPRDSDSWATPRAFFDPLDKEFAFTVDAAASHGNAKCDRFWTPAEDGLAQDWAGERVWCNPPYSSIRPWIQKGAYFDAEISVFLLPARVGSDWFHDYILDETKRRFRPGVQVRWLRGRVKFSGARKFPAWDSMVVVFDGR